MLFSNIVLLNKVGRYDRLCIDFTYVNMGTPKDCFPLPNLDQLVDTTIDFEIMSFMDAYLRYHHIRMHLGDDEKTTFITEE